MEVDESFVQRQEFEHCIRHCSDMKDAVASVIDDDDNDTGNEFPGLLDLNFSTDSSDNEPVHETPGNWEEMVKKHAKVSLCALVIEVQRLTFTSRQRKQARSLNQSCKMKSCRGKVK